MRAVLFLVLLAWLLPSATFADESCAPLAGVVSTARAAGTAEAIADAWSAVTAQSESCDTRARYCLGHLLALGQLDIAYKSAESGEADLERLTRLAEDGLKYGAPWQLAAGLGDLYLEQGRLGGGGAAYSRAALHYQQAMISIGEPPVCGDYGEEVRPTVDSIATLYQHLSTALLLAEPLEVATTKCAPCQWLFFSGVGGFTPDVRPLPITFAKGASQPTAEGMDAIAALLQCLKAGGQEHIVLSGHADARGDKNYNLRLSKRRLETVAAALVEGGYEGRIDLEPMGEARPFPGDLGDFSVPDRLRLERRIELREISDDVLTQCS